MAVSAPQRCGEPGCRTLVRSGRCPEHRLEAARARGTTKERGYDSRCWKKVRIMKLARQHLCEDCAIEGIVTEATQVHHIVAIRDNPRKRLQIENLKSLCGPCHERIEAAKRVQDWAIREAC